MKTSKTAKHTVIAQTFFPNFFEKGHNLFAIVVEYPDYFYIQLGHATKRVKTKDYALKIYFQYLEAVKSHLV